SEIVSPTRYRDLIAYLGAEEMDFNNSAAACLMRTSQLDAFGPLATANRAAVPLVSNQHPLPIDNSHSPSADTTCDHLLSTSPFISFPRTTRHLSPVRPCTSRSNTPCICARAARVEARARHHAWMRTAASLLRRSSERSRRRALAWSVMDASVDTDDAPPRLICRRPSLPNRGIMGVAAQVGEWVGGCGRGRAMLCVRACVRGGVNREMRSDSTRVCLL
ncbi:unnamed protein product, partial [Mycena citricolor]